MKKYTVVCADFIIHVRKKELPIIRKKLIKSLKGCGLDFSRGGISFYDKIELKGE